MVKGVDEIADDFYEKGFSVCNDFVSPLEVDQLVSALEEKRDTFQKAGIGSGKNLAVDVSVRGDFIKWVE
jgi:hypothetical protein